MGFCIFTPSKKGATLSFLKKLFSRITSGAQRNAHIYPVYVRCGQCGEKLQIQINLWNDLSIQYGDTDKEDVYFTRKQIVGRSGCCKPIEVELTFDRQRHVKDRKIQGGQFITEEEFLAG
jgi:hypothetical protein